MSPPRTSGIALKDQALPVHESVLRYFNPESARTMTTGCPRRGGVDLHMLGANAFWGVVNGSADGDDTHVERYLDGGWSAEFPTGTC